MITKIIYISSLLLLSFNIFSQDLQDSLTVYFDFNKYNLSDNQKTKLISFIDNFDSSKLVNNIKIIAYCDSIGSVNYNNNLSLNRCKFVAKIVTKRFPDVDSELIAKGKTNFISDNNSEQGRALNRHSDIIIQYSENKQINKLVESKTKDSTKYSKNKIEGQVIEKGKNIVLKKMNFQGGRHSLVASGRFALKRLLQTMKDNPNLKIEIQGHICCSKPNEDGYDFDTGTMNLSTNRAKAVFDYLVNNGIDSTRMTYIGMKGDYPLVFPELTPADENANRRVEIKVLEY